MRLTAPAVATPRAAEHRLVARYTDTVRILKAGRITGSGSAARRLPDSDAPGQIAVGM
ncbi:hypothetical protein [Streptomyces sp. NPDC088707]|uniref:hypothetical protein n=1 Tax=Streptomyces sp. NPDC088707 TaxID=3365871 RepID=UPI0037FBF788